MRTYTDLGIQTGEVLLPKTGTDLEKWAVIACDQFTSQPGYWDKVHEIVGNAPSTLHLILPEVFLGSPENKRASKVFGRRCAVTWMRACWNLTKG